MTPDQKMVLISTVGNVIAGVGAAVAALLMWLQTRQQFAAKQRAWLLEELPRLRESAEITVEEANVAHAVYWLQNGLLEWVPTNFSGRLVVRMRR